MQGAVKMVGDRLVLFGLVGRAMSCESVVNTVLGLPHILC